MNVVTFTEVDGGRGSRRSECPSKEVRDLIIGSGMEGGAQEGMDLLEDIAIELGRLDG